MNLDGDAAKWQRKSARQRWEECALLIVENEPCECDLYLAELQ